MNSANNAIENYINSNIQDAKRLARRVPGLVLFDKLREEYGKSEAASLAIAQFLKGLGTFQQACDADYRHSV